MLISFYRIGGVLWKNRTFVAITWMSYILTIKTTQHLHLCNVYKKCHSNYMRIDVVPRGTFQAPFRSASVGKEFLEVLCNFIYAVISETLTPYCLF